VLQRGEKEIEEYKLGLQPRVLATLGAEAPEKNCGKLLFPALKRGAIHNGINPTPTG